MPDIGTISAALSSIQSATEIAKYLKNIDSTFEKAELRLKVAELMEALADSKMSISEILQLILEKDSKINELQEILNQKENLIYKTPVYYLLKGESKDGPFCQRCYDGEGKFSRLMVGNFNFGDNYFCKVCKTAYK